VIAIVIRSKKSTWKICVTAINDNKISGAVMPEAIRD